MNEKTFNHLIAFWRSVEALSPQSIPKRAETNHTEPVCDWLSSTPAPWVDPAFKRRTIPPNKAWRHTVYGATYRRADFVEQLTTRLGTPPDVFEERLDGEACVFSLAFDEHGRALPESFMLGMAAWACGVVTTYGLDALCRPGVSDTAGLQVPGRCTAEALPSSNTGIPSFDTLLNALRADLAWRIGNLPQNHPAEDLGWFDAFVRNVIDRCRIVSLVGERPTHRVRSFQTYRPKVKPTSGKETDNKRVKGDEDLLNSFYIRDLNRILLGGLANAGDCLRRFLEPPTERPRIDVRRDRRQALDLLAPRLFPEGCWPAEHPLVWSQQLAVNALWRDLADSSGMFAVNGPPGTGKTTLLRDVVAAVIVERAKVLVDGGAGLLGEGKSIGIGEYRYNYHLLDPRLAGFSIVVASSNNGAVENVSLELPKADAIHSVWVGKSQAFADLASFVIGQDAWAMIAGRLGNKENRTEFVNRFWWPNTDKGAEIPGMRERLERIVKGKDKPALSWADAVKAFRNARAAEAEWRKRLVSMSDVPARIERLKAEKEGMEADLRRAQEQRETAIADRSKLVGQIAAADTEIDMAQQHLERQLAIKPGFLEWLTTLGRAQREWRATVTQCTNDLRRLEAVRATLRRQMEDVTRNLEDAEQIIARQERRIPEKDTEIEETESELAEAKAFLGEHWPALEVDEETQERSSPWALKEWRETRIRMFLAALDVHRAFVEANAGKMRDNLGLAMQMLGNGIPDPNVRALALYSLAIVCPVISTTFASVPSLFADLGPGSIGWLLIDEAGQATPPAAAGAIWRARRVVVVGDPLQLEPIVTIPRTIETALARSHGDVDHRWRPRNTSVQRLADETTPTGTVVGEGSDAIWVGAPLRVHRRCDEPMFSISNRVAYDGLMVHQKKPSALSWPASGWIDVPKSPANGNWIPAEGEAVRDLLRALLRSGVPAAEIFLISPFRDVVQELERIGRTFRLHSNRVGTVHTTQGKEAQVVILVLGGGTSPARNWAAKKPNLLNVAASRAKARLYVIGDRADWSRRPYFDVLVRELGIANIGAEPTPPGSGR